jgi:hypothetical protein
MKLLRKIVITGVVGGVTFTVTTLAEQPPAWSWLLAVFVSGVVLVTQFLIEVDSRLDGLRSEINQVAAAGKLFELPTSGPLSRDMLLQLVAHASELDRAAPDLGRQLAEAEIDRTSAFVQDLVRGRQIVYDGDDWYWCLSLTRSVRASIDATTYLRKQRGDTLIDDDLWVSELGQRYLHLQAEAVQRGVTVRRIFIVEDAELTGHPHVRQLVAQQLRLGIQSCVLDASDLPNATGTYIPFVIFDNSVLYEQTPTRFPAAPGYAKTTLILEAPPVQNAAKRFQQLWSAAQSTS